MSLWRHNDLFSKNGFKGVIKIGLPSVRHFVLFKLHVKTHMTKVRNALNEDRSGGMESMVFFKFSFVCHVLGIFVWVRLSFFSV